MARWSPWFLASVLASGCVLDRAPLHGEGADAGIPDVPGLDAALPDVPPDDAPDLDAPAPDAPEPDAGSDAPIDALSCTMSRCIDGDRLEECVGGVAMERICELGCTWGGGAHCRRVAPTNVGSALFQDDAPGVRLMDDTSWSTADCGSLPRGTMTGTGAGEVCVVRVGELFLREGRVLTITGPRGLVILATGMVELLGDVDASAHGTTPGPGGGRGGDAMPATGIAIGQPGGFAGGYADSGGGGGALCGNGGEGGGGGAAPRGTRGYGSGRSLEPAYGGSGGGRGGHGLSAGEGGAGGGSIQITSRVGIRVVGRLSAAGGGGRGGRDGEVGDDNIGAGGGGGSGGGVLLESLSIEVLDGTIDVSGGGGGGAASCLSRGDGGHGRDGIEDIGAALGGAIGRTCTAGMHGARGGTGGGASFDDAGDGFGNAGEDSNGGGGGGGSGCIVFRTPRGVAPTPGTFDADESTEAVRTETVRAID